jgi:hypothetical protein
VFTAETWLFLAIKTLEPAGQKRESMLLYAQCAARRRKEGGAALVNLFESPFGFGNRPFSLQQAAGIGKLGQIVRCALRERIGHISLVSGHMHPKAFLLKVIFQ